MRLKVTNPALVQAIVLHLSLNGYKVDTNIKPSVRPDLISSEVEIQISDLPAKLVSNYQSAKLGTWTPDVTSFQEFLEWLDSKQNPIKITDGSGTTYDVIIKKDGIKVGCADIPWETVEKIVARKPKS